MRRGRANRGQASIEWIVVVGVVVAALVVAGAASGAPQVAGVVVREFRRALCIVARGDCNEDRAPCVTASDTDIEDSSLNLGLVKLTSTTTMLIERRSDGLWRVTVTHDDGGGFEAGIGEDFAVSGLGLKLALGGEARASVLAHAAAGETWLAHSRAEAQYLGALLRFGKYPRGEQPAQRFSHQGRRINLGGSLTAPAATLGVQLTRDDVDGVRIDTATGRTTTYLRSRFDQDVSADLGRTLGLSLSGTQSTDFALTTDRTGRPVDFVIFSVGRSSAGVGLPGIMRRAPIKPNTRAAKGEAWEHEVHLDLTDPGNAAAVGAFMRSRRDSGDLGPLTVAVRGLAARLAVDGTEHVRLYSIDQDSFGASGHVAAGLKIGGFYRRSSATMKLLDARVRGPDGIWTTRDDCVQSPRP